MRKSSLALPVKYQNQARLIKQRNHRHSLEYRSMPVKTHFSLMYDGKSKNDFSCHETWRNNVAVCWQLSKLPELAQYRSVAHMDPSSINHPWFSRLWGISIMPLMGSVSWVWIQTSKCHCIITQYHIKSITIIHAMWHDVKCNKSLKISRNGLIFPEIAL